MKKIKCEDHLGNEFPTLKDMCCFHNINTSTYKYRISQGMSVEEALTLDVFSYDTTDHIGNIFASVEKMCEHYSITRATYRHRIERGWTLEKTLTTPQQQSKYSCTDHLGNVFTSKRKMFEYWHIDHKVFEKRICEGWSLKAALETPPIDLSVRDHLGNIHSSENQMIKYWNIDSGTYRARIRNGLSLEQALTLPVGTFASGYEIKLKEYLTNCNIPFVTEDNTTGCLSSGGGRSRFDFSIPNIGLIEIDGEQHFGFAPNWDVISIIENDTLKTKYCEENNIPLLRIRYDQMQDGTYVDLIEDFIANPEDYIKQHNKCLTEAEYYAEREINLIKH